MNEKTKSLIGLHIGIFLVGITGLLAKVMSSSVLFIVFGRVMFAAAALGLFLAYRKKPVWPRNWRDAGGFLLIGALLALHWYAFFYAIQISTVALGLLTMMTFPVFTTILEPFFFRAKLGARDVLIAALCAIGVWMVAPIGMSDLDPQYITGAIWGVAAGFLISLVLLMNKKYVQSYSAINVTFYQCAVAFVLTLPFMVWSGESILPIDWLYVFLNGVICTALAHSLFIFSARILSAQVVSVTAIMELFYGAVLAYLILGEGLEGNMIFGGVLIVGASYLAIRKSE
mgnify:CR=1 FL=1